MAEPVSPSPGALSSPPLTTPSPSAASGAGAQAGGTNTLDVSVDPSLEALVPTALGSFRFERHSLTRGGPLAPGVSDALLRELLQASARSTRDLAVAWSAPAPADAARALGLTISAIRLRGADARELRPIVVGDSLLSLVGKGGLYASDETPGLAWVTAGTRSIGTSGDTIFIQSWPLDGDPNAPVPDSSTLGWTYEDLMAALPKTDAFEPLPTPGPIPSVAPHASSPPDPAVAALLPDSIAGRPVQKVSGNVLSLMTDSSSSTGGVVAALPAYMLVMTLGLDPARMSAALGHADGLSSFVAIVTRAPGTSARRLLGGFAGYLARNGGLNDVETIDVKGRAVQLLKTQALYATDGVLYWMSYLDLGDSFGATPPPRPALRDLVVDTIGALP